MHSRNQWIGYIVLFIGISIFLSVIGLNMLVGPLLFVCLGLFFLQRRSRLVGLIFFTIAAMTFFQSVLHINVGGLLVALLFIYFGYRMVTGKKLPRWMRSERRRHPRHWDHWDHHEKHEEKRRRKAEKEARKEAKKEEDWLDEEIEKLHQESKKKATDFKTEPDPEPTGEGHIHFTFKTPRFRNSLIGDFHLLDHRFELDDMNLSYGIGDVKIDLSKAIIPEGESTIAISGFIGDVDIYVPYDLDVSVNASATIGELKVLGYKQGGLNRQIGLSTKGYDQSLRKVKISISTFIGDVDVRFL